MYIYVYIFLRCAEFSYRKVEQALKSAFGKGLRTKQRRTWKCFLSRSKQFKERDKKIDYPKNAVLFGAQLWFCIPAAAKRKNLRILMLEAIQVCWGGLTPRLLDCRDSPASDVESPETETALKSSWLLQGNVPSCWELKVIGSKAQVTS